MITAITELPEDAFTFSNLKVEVVEPKRKSDKLTQNLLDVFLDVGAITNDI